MNVPAKPDPMAEFQEKLRERVRNDIRDLLPEAAIGALVQKAIDQEFFTERMIEVGSGWNARDKKAPSLFVEACIEAAKPIIAEQVAKFLVEHPADIEAVIEKFLDKNVLATAVAQRLTLMLSNAVMNLEQKLTR